MLRRAFWLALVVSSGLQALAQAPATPSPTFEVASVKRNTSGDPGMSMGTRPGGWGMVNGPTRSLLLAAYPSQTPEIIGAPEWVDAERYDVIAKTDGAATPEQRQQMLRALLADRFRLVAHRETHQRPIYLLVVDRSDGRLGPELRRSELDCATMVASAGNRPNTPAAPRANGAPPCGMSASSGKMVSGGITMVTLARSISNAAGRVVMDGTGLDGSYEFTLQYSAQPTSSPDAPAATDSPAIFTALREQLGLRLAPQQGPLEILTVDSIERPTPD